MDNRGTLTLRIGAKEVGRTLKTLVGAFTRPGDVVLDPFCGSGSTLAAARELERCSIGIDLDPAHHRTARQRMAGMLVSIGKTV
jgi:DNA modification methylase